MSEESDELADRIRAFIGHRPGITEKKMFGGVCFMHYGNMLVGAMKPGSLLARVGPARFQEAQARPGATAIWIAYSEAFVQTLPPK